MRTTQKKKARPARNLIRAARRVVVEEFDNASQTPYLSRGTGLAKQQLWYDDPPSIATKTAAARALGLSLSGCWTADALDYSADAPIAADDFWQALRI